MKKFNFTYHIISDFWEQYSRTNFFRSETIEDAYFEFGRFIGRVTNHEDKVVIDSVTIEEI